MRSLRSLLALAVCASLLLALPPTSSASARTHGTTAPSRVLVVGDSITAHSAGHLRALQPRWDIDGVGGRPVLALPKLLAARMAAGPAPRVVVVGLGANAREGWTKQDYQDALALLPASTRVVLVTTFRDPRRFPESGRFGTKPSVMRAYATWMREIAAERPGTCVAEWRRLAHRRPWLLRDGVHPTVRGKSVWARLISRTAHHCRSSAGQAGQHLGAR